MRFSRSALLTGALLLVGVGCARRAGGHDGLVRLEVAPSAAGAVLTLIPAPGARINAKNRPVLELKNGIRLEFNQDALTADSGYFAAPPTAAFPGKGRLTGVLRIGVCPAGENVCLPLTIPIDQALPPG